MGELLSHYRRLTVGGPPPPPAPPFRDYIAWLQRRGSDDAARSFWVDRLSGVRPSHLAPLLPADPQRSTGSGDRRRVFLPADVDQGLRDAAVRHRVTFGTMAQAAWAIVLRRYSGQAEVTFGSVSSGRPPELPQVDRMVGMFANTLPARVTVPDDGDLGAWLRDLQMTNAQMRRYEYIPLADIKRWAGAPGQQLFESLMGSDNYTSAVDALAMPDRLTFRHDNAFDKINYPVACPVNPGAAGIEMLIHSGTVQARLHQRGAGAAASHLDGHDHSRPHRPGDISRRPGHRHAGPPHRAERDRRRRRAGPARDPAGGGARGGLPGDPRPGGGRVTASFFELGGDSFDAVRAISRIDGASVGKPPPTRACGNSQARSNPRPARSRIPACRTRVWTTRSPSSSNSWPRCGPRRRSWPTPAHSSGAAGGAVGLQLSTGGGLVHAPVRRRPERAPPAACPAAAWPAGRRGARAGSARPGGTARGAADEARGRRGPASPGDRAGAGGDAVAHDRPLPRPVTEWAADEHPGRSTRAADRCCASPPLGSARRPCAGAGDPPGRRRRLVSDGAGQRPGRAVHRRGHRPSGRAANPRHTNRPTARPGSERGWTGRSWTGSSGTGATPWPDCPLWISRRPATSGSTHRRRRQHGTSATDRVGHRGPRLRADRASPGTGRPTRRTVDRPAPLRRPGRPADRVHVLRADPPRTWNPSWGTSPAPSSCAPTCPAIRASPSWSTAATTRCSAPLPTRTSRSVWSSTRCDRPGSRVATRCSRSASPSSHPGIGSGLPLDLGNTTAEVIDLPERPSPYDISVDITDSLDGQPQLSVKYSTELFDADRMHRFLDHYVTALANGLAAPDTAVGAIELTTTRPGVVSSARS